MPDLFKLFFLYAKEKEMRGKKEQELQKIQKSSQNKKKLNVEGFKKKKENYRQ